MPHGASARATLAVQFAELVVQVVVVDDDDDVSLLIGACWENFHSINAEREMFDGAVARYDGQGDQWSVCSPGAKKVRSHGNGSRHAHDDRGHDDDYGDG